jgi:NTE family protein
VGALNGWAVAGGCAPDDLIDLWLNLRPDWQDHLHWPRSPLDGLIDGESFLRFVRSHHERFRPQIDAGVVVTDLRRLRPVLFTGDSITWQHLAASCAVLGVFPQQRIGREIYSDGGLLNALPIWAAAAMGADRIVAINAMAAGVPSRTARWFVQGLRSISRYRPPAARNVHLAQVSPPAHLGAAPDMIRWKRDNVERWIDQGYHDAIHQNISHEVCFEAQ